MISVPQHWHAPPPRGPRGTRTALTHLLLAGTVIVPHVAVGGVVLGADDFAALVLLAILFPILVGRRTQPLAPSTVLIGFLWFATFVHGVIMGITASAEYLGAIHLPTEMWQYLKRMAFFYAAFALAASGAPTAPAYKALTAVLIVAALIGVLQIGSGPISEFLGSLYARTDWQLERLVGRELATLRTYGVAGNATAWGGFSVFSAAIALPFVFAGRERRGSVRRSWRLMFLALFALASINLLFSASRAAIGAFTAVFLMTGLFELTVRRGGVAAFSKWFLLVAVMTALALYFALDRLALLAFRFLALAEESGGDRMNQVVWVLSLLDSWSAVLTGVGNAVQRFYGVSHGVEVEPVYVLVNYGIIGMITRYGLLLAVGVLALGLIRHPDRWLSALGMAGCLSLVGYAVFSFGYFFFQELYVAVVPWLVFGLIAGTQQRLWRMKVSAPGSSVRLNSRSNDSQR